MFWSTLISIVAGEKAEKARELLGKSETPKRACRESNSNGLIAQAAAIESNGYTDKLQDDNSS